MRTRITELLGIEHPIFQGAMAWIADASLASAVSNAGGLGILAGGSASADVMARQIDEAKARTDRPFALNIMLMSPHADDLAQLAIDKGVQAVTTGAGDVRTISDTLYPAAAVDRLYCSGLIQPSDSFGLSSL